jgi:hypothetical protein
MSDNDNRGITWLLTPLERSDAMDGNEPNRPSAGAAAALVRRGYVQKVDRDLLRPLYIITPEGLTAWKQIEVQP